jgi:putative ABC transport system permease protein
MNDKDRAVAAVAILTAVLAAPLAMLTLLATLIDSAQDDIVPDVAPQQLVLSSTMGHLHPPTPETVNVVSAHLHTTTAPIQVAYGWTADAKVSVEGGGKGTVLIVDTVDHVNQLNEGPLTQTQAETLQHGGMLVWNDNGTNQRALINYDIASKERTTTPPIPAIHADFQPAWKTSVDGLLLTATATRLGLPFVRAAIVFTDVTNDQAQSAKQAVLDAGLDPAQVGIHQPPDPIRVPTPFYGAAFGLATIVLITTMAVARTQVSTLRSYLGRLISVGLPTSWVRQVLLLQSALVIAVSTLLGLLIAVAAVFIAALRLPGLTLTFPWQWITLTLLAYYAATLTATLLSARRLRPADRLTT